MKIYEDLLTATIDQPPQSINEATHKMLVELTKQIKTNKNTRKNGDLIFELTPSKVIFPKFINQEKIKTKWQKFAEKKGIEPRKKERQVWDEELQKYLPTWGSKSKHNLILRSGIVPTTKDKSISKLKKEKQERVQKNKKNRENNSKRIREAMK